MEGNQNGEEMTKSRSTQRERGRMSSRRNDGEIRGWREEVKEQTEDGETEWQ